MNEGTQYDAPNQQVVRPDGSAPWEEGEGGTTHEEQPNPLDSMTKAELLDYAYDLGVDVDESATKADIRAVIDQAEGR